VKAKAERPFHAGTIGLIGRPNVGKSTLLNALTGAKLSITSRKPQTTRHRIQGIVNRPETQYVFVDTPGFQTRFKSALNRAMNRGVQLAQDEVDVLVLVVEAGRLQAEDLDVLKRLELAKKPLLVAINKSDLLRPAEMLPFIQDISGSAGFQAIVPVSAQKRRGLEMLLKAIRPHLPGQPALYAEDELTDKSERFLAAELLREKLFRSLGDELPYGLSTTIEKFEALPRLYRIFAGIIVDKDPHKAIVIGKHGEQLKRIATSARLDMERLFGKKVHLEVWVKVRHGWQDDPEQIKKMGYE
jgi:GTP-binding protein Era